MLKSVSEAISELMTNYERVLESVRDMQQNRTLLPWDDFNKILKTLSGVSRLHFQSIEFSSSTNQKSFTPLLACKRRMSAQVL